MTFTECVLLTMLVIVVIAASLRAVEIVNVIH